MLAQSMASKASGRAPRPKVIQVEEVALAARWRPLAQLKVIPFAWDGSMYAKPCRNQGVDREGLVAHSTALQPLLEFAPPGFPSHSSLKNVFLELNKDFKILDCPEKFAHKCAASAADIWRIMCKDVYDLAKGKSKNNKDELQKLVDIIALGLRTADHAAEAPAAEMARLKTREDVDQLFGLDDLEDGETDAMTDDADVGDKLDADECDEVLITAEICNCPDCRAQRSRQPPAAAAQTQPAANIT